MNSMKFTVIAALAVLAAAPALAQAPAPAALPTVAPATGGYSVDKTTIGTLWADPLAKAVLQKVIPEVEQYLDQIGNMTLTQIAPMSQCALDDAKLKAIQAGLDAIKN
jgi:hypothetical protein